MLISRVVRQRFRGKRVLYGLCMTASLLVGQLAYADVVVIVSAKSTASSLTSDQISEIFLGRSNTLKPVDNAAKSPVRGQFYSKVTGKDEAQIRAIWSKLVFTGKASPPKELPSDAEVVKAVAADPEAIGYVDKSAVDPSVKIVFEPK